MGCRGGTNVEQWISDTTWNLIDKRKEAKNSRDQARTRARQCAKYVQRFGQGCEKSCKQDNKDWIEIKCNQTQAAADRNDIRTLYCVVRQVTCVNNNNNNVPIKCKEGKMLLAEEQKARWMEHFQEVLNQPDLADELDLGNDVPMNLLEVNMTDVTAAEVNQAVDSLTNNTAPDIDEILAQLLKHGKDVITGQLVIRQYLA